RVEGLPGEGPAPQREDHGPEGAHGCPLGGREEADVDAAHHEEEERGHRPHVLEGEQALPPRRSLARGPRGQVAPRHVLHGPAEQEGAEDTGGEAPGDRSPGGPEARSRHVMYCTAPQSRKAPRIPGRMPAANSLPILVSVKTP